MAAIDSPRRILGERDVNKPLFTKPSSTSNSPSKSATISHSPSLQEENPHLGKLSQADLSPKLHEISPAPAPVSSWLGSRKRGSAYLGNAHDGPPRKQAVIGLPQQGFSGIQPRTGESKTRPLQSPLDDCRVEAAVVESTSDGRPLRRSISPDSSFDTTQDSELLDSQITNITEPEDTVPITLPPLIAVPLTAPRVASQEETRENAEALRLRLKVAMYKVKTNQTDLPLSQVQIRSLNAHHLTRTLLPTSRLAPSPHCGKPVTPTSHPSQFRDDGLEDPTSIPSSSPPPPMSPNRLASHAHDPRRSDFATPILPLSRDCNSPCNSRGSPGPGPGPEATSSVVKGRAADGLLSLMAAGPRDV